MVEEETRDGRRIAELLASEIEGHERGPLGALSVANADRSVEASLDGERAYDVVRDGERVASVFVHEDRARIDVRENLTAAGDAAREAGLRVRPKAVEPPALVVFVETGAEVKRALPALRALAV